MLDFAIRSRRRRAYGLTMQHVVMAVVLLWCVVPSRAGTRTVNVTANANVRYEYDATIRRINTAEEQLLDEQRYASAIRKLEIQKELSAIRAERLETERLRAEAEASRAEAARESSKSVVVINNAQSAEQPSTQSSGTDRPGVIRAEPPPPPERDWKKEESPEVVVKAIMKQGGRYCAMVSGGKIVFSNDVFSTSFNGQHKYWRVTSIDRDQALFAPVTADGAPLTPVAP